MSKKQLLFFEAERMYTIDQQSPEVIAAQLRTCEKTIRLWKEEGGWAEKRAAYRKSRNSTHEELYELLRLLTKGIKEDIVAGRKTDMGRCILFKTITDKIGKVKGYEDATVPKTTNSGKNVEKDVIRLIEEQLMGGPAEPPAAPAPAGEPAPQEPAAGDNNK